MTTHHTDDLAGVLAAIVSGVPGVRHIYPAHGRVAEAISEVVSVLPGVDVPDRSPIGIDEDAGTVSISIGVIDSESAAEVAREVSRAVVEYLAVLAFVQPPTVRVRVASVG